MKKALAIMLILSVALCGIATADEVMYMAKWESNKIYESNITNIPATRPLNITGAPDWVLFAQGSPTVPTGNNLNGIDVVDGEGNLQLYAASNSTNNIYFWDTVTTVNGTTVPGSISTPFRVYGLDVVGSGATKEFFVTTGTGVARLNASGTTLASVSLTGMGSVTHGDIEVVGDTVYISVGGTYEGGSLFVWTLPTNFTSASTATELLDKTDFATELQGHEFCELDTDGTTLWVGVSGMHRIAEFDISGTPTFTRILEQGGIGNGVYDVELGQDGFLYAAINTGVSQWNVADGTYTGLHWSESTFAPGHLALTPAGAAIPEPAGLGLLGIALLGLRKKKRS